MIEAWHVFKVSRLILDRSVSAFSKILFLTFSSDID